jgi:bifunctional DNase/RNase
MRRRVAILTVGGLVVLSVLAAFFCLGKETSPSFVQMEVKGVRMDPVTQNPVVILADKAEKRAIPIWIGLLEATAIEKELKNTASPRPMTHDLLYSILGHVEARVKEVRITNLKDHTYYATLFLTVNRKEIEVDARPSDAIIIALKSKAPISIAAGILTDQGVSLTQGGQAAETHGIRVQELTPDLASHFGLKEAKGVLVSEVISGSASEASGIKAGDIISRVNLKEVGSLEEFDSALEAVKGASSIRFTVFREGKTREITISLKP